MEPLVTAKQMLIWLCICPSPKSSSKSTKIAHILCTILVFMGNVLGTITHSMFLFKLSSIDVKGSVFSFMGATGFAGMIYVMITAFSFRYQVRAILDQLSIIYDTRKLKI